MKYFYEDILELQILPHTLLQAQLEDHEKKELLETAKSTIHHEIITLILSELDEEQQDRFLLLLHEEDHKTLIEELKSWIENFEVKVKQKIRETELELSALFEEE